MSLSPSIKIQICYFIILNISFYKHSHVEAFTYVILMGIHTIRDKTIRDQTIRDRQFVTLTIRDKTICDTYNS